jgi:hypothetical protein
MKPFRATPRRMAYAVAAVGLIVLSGCGSTSGNNRSVESGGNDLAVRPAAAVVGAPLMQSCPLWGSPQTPSSHLPVTFEGSRTGDDIIVSGYVITAATCQGLENARVEFWHAGPDGRYQVDMFRSNTWTDDRGAFTLSLSRPGTYGNAPSHVHVLVSAEGFGPQSFSIMTDTDQRDIHLPLPPGSGV